jgi:hypothetical protein
MKLEQTSAKRTSYHGVRKWRWKEFKGTQKNTDGGPATKSIAFREIENAKVCVVQKEELTRHTIH